MGVVFEKKSSKSYRKGGKGGKQEGSSRPIVLDMDPEKIGERIDNLLDEISNRIANATQKDPVSVKSEILTDIKEKLEEMGFDPEDPALVLGMLQKLRKEVLSEFPFVGTIDAIWEKVYERDDGSKKRYLFMRVSGEHFKTSDPEMIEKIRKSFKKGDMVEIKADYNVKGTAATIIEIKKRKMETRDISEYDGSEGYYTAIPILVDQIKNGALLRVMSPENKEFQMVVYIPGEFVNEATELLFSEVILHLRQGKKYPLVSKVMTNESG